MKKSKTILEEVPNTEQGLKLYVIYSEKAIKDCRVKEKELEVAMQEAKRRLDKIEDSKKIVQQIS